MSNVRSSNLVHFHLGWRVPSARSNRFLLSLATSLQRPKATTHAFHLPVSSEIHLLQHQSQLAPSTRMSGVEAQTLGIQSELQEAIFGFDHSAVRMKHASDYWGSYDHPLTSYRQMSPELGFGGA